MEIIANELDWLATDEQNLAAFLDTPTGKRFIPKLFEQSPSLLQNGDTNAILIRNGLVLGFQEVARTILALAHPAPKITSETATAYPSLEDDTKFEGPKLSDPPETFL